MNEEEFFLNLLKENWINARHQETQRMWFANIFSAIFVGTLAYVAHQRCGGISQYLPYGLLAISIIGLLITMKVNRVFEDYKQSIKNILQNELFHLKDDKRLSYYTGMFTADKTRWKYIKVRCLCISLYGAGIGFSIALIVPP